MKNRMLPLLLLSTAVALPGFAQQTDSTVSSAGATTQSGGELAPIPPDNPKNFWDGDDPNIVNLVTHPFANKKYVQRHVAPIRDRINELEELTAENSKQIKDVDARATQGIQLASEKSSAADQHATEQMVSSLDQYKSGAQTEIRFRPGETVLSKSAKDALDAMAAPLKDQRNYIIEVRGYAPGRGSAAIASSQKMADSVVRYLVLSHQIPVYRIYAMSMGNAAAPGTDGTMAKSSNTGRVEVSLLKNDVVGAAQP
jgi:outer membrane protein OmpA-like peptidoglycan-associated protein